MAYRWEVAWRGMLALQFRFDNDRGYAPAVLSPGDVTEMTKRVRSLLYVVVQFATSAALVLSVQPDRVKLAPAIVSAIGLAIGVWSIVAMRVSQLSVLPDVGSDAGLVTTGPYRWIRHPMYSGLMLFTLGFVFMPGQWWKPIAWCVLVVTLWLKAAFEEQLLGERFATYADYRGRTKRFLPFIC